MPPSQVSDGDYSTPKQSGPWSDTERPFSEDGDFDTYIKTRTMKVDANSFIAPIPMTQFQFPRERNSTGYLIDFQGPLPDENNIVSYKEMYAPVPKSRIVYGPVVFTQSYRSESGALIQSTDEVQGAYLYEYSKDSPLPTILSTKFASTQDGIVIIGGPSLATNQPVKILVKDAISRPWKAKIYERVSITTTTQRILPYNP